MGSIRFTTDPKLTFKSASQTSAEIRFSAAAIAQPNAAYEYEYTIGYEDEEKKQYRNYNHYKGYYTIGEVAYTWTFNDNKFKNVDGSSGTYSYKTLIAGESNILEATCKISVNETDHWTTTEHRWEISSYEMDEETGDFKLDENGEKIPIYTEKTNSYNNSSSSVITAESSTTLTVYTYPGAFIDYNFSKDTIIQSSEGLTEEKVSNWCDHAGKFLSWKKQDDKYGSVDSCKVIKGSLITADWYNKCADAVGSSLRVNKGDLITALAFKNLGDAIN